MFTPVHLDKEHLNKRKGFIIHSCKNLLFSDGISVISRICTFNGMTYVKPKLHRFVMC